MSRYQSLFSVAIEHSFYLSCIAPSLTIEPSQSCLEHLHKAGLFFQPGVSCFTVLHAPQMVNRLRDYIADFRGGLHLGFKLFSRDPQWDLVTQAAQMPKTHMVFLDSRRARFDSFGMQLLHQGDVVTQHDHKRVDCKLVTQHLQRADRIVRPAAIVQIVLTPDQTDLCRSSSYGSDLAQHQFTLRFAAAQSYWKYYCVGELAMRDISISDKGKSINFNNLGVVNLSGNRLAKVFMSDVMLPMQERHELNLQLRENGELAEKILIKRMPNPRPDHVFREMVYDKEALVSEIYINQ